MIAKEYNMKQKSNDIRYFNRELSWIEFNRRVLYEGVRSDKPLLERLKFLSIVSSNFDEFFMVRVASLKTQYLQGNYTNCPSRMSPEEQLKAIYREYREMLQQQYRVLLEEILPELKSRGFRYLDIPDLNAEQKSSLKKKFLNDYFPLLTPVRVNGREPMVKSGNMRLHAGFVLTREGESEEHLAVVQLPSSADRIIRLPSKEGSFYFTLLENLVVMFASSIFPGYEVKEHAMFRITRDADFAVDESRDEDFVEAMEQVLSERLSSEAVRLNCSNTSAKIKDLLRESLNLTEDEVFITPNPLELGDFMDLVFVHGFDSLRDEPWKPVDILPDAEDLSIWDWIKTRDRLLLHPFESFSPVMRMLEAASQDEGVLAIKMTLYRTSKNSPIVRALEAAAQNGKQVTVLVELKARFDEKRNIEWAERLERSGVIVVYGIAELKVHAKAMLIIRREERGISRYLHLGTGNYNDKTARLYTDIGLITAREDLCYEAGLFFNAITGYSAVPALSKLSMAPHNLKNKILQLIEREQDKHSRENPGHIMVKINSLSDPVIIDALYQASKAGVRIDMNIRGICMLKPGVKGLSENIRVVSVIDRYLEHPRALYFLNGGSPEVYISSADWMGRNLDRRVELLTPVEDPRCAKSIQEMLEVYMKDNFQAYELQKDGSYRRVSTDDPKKRVHAQWRMYQKARDGDHGDGTQNTRVFNVRRRPPKATQG